MINQNSSLPMLARFVAGILILAASFITAMDFGAANTTVKEIWLAITSTVKTDTITMIREIRLPREVAAIFVGAALSVAGAIMQGLTRNPLADPGL